GPRHVVEDVEQDEVRERAVGVRERLGVDDLLRVRRLLDVRGHDERKALLETADARPELDGRSGDLREGPADLLVPVPVQSSDERPGVPGFELEVEHVAEHGGMMAKRERTFRTRGVALLAFGSALSLV